MARNTHQKLKLKVYKRDRYTCRLKLSPKCPGDMSVLYQRYLAGKITRRKALITVDHNPALANGGAWQLAQLLTACTYCNHLKGDKEFSPTAV